MQLVSDDPSDWERLDLRSLQNHKIRLLLHQRAAPPASKLNDTIDASDFDEQPRSCQSSQEVHQTLVISEDRRCSCRSVGASIDTKRVLCREYRKEGQTSDLKCQSCKLEAVSDGEICVILGRNRCKSTASALNQSQRELRPERGRARTDLGAQEKQCRSL